MRYFKKELVSNPLRLPNGTRAPFEVHGSDTGLLATEDAGLITELERAVARKVGGVVEVSQEQYDGIKKNPPVRRLHATSLNAQSIRRVVDSVSRTQNNGKTAPVVEANKSAPMAVPDGLVTTASVRKLKEMRAKAASAKEAEGSQAAQTSETSEKS